MYRSQPRVFAVLALVTVVATLAASCGGSDAKAAKPLTTQQVISGIAKQLKDSNALDQSSATCVAKRVARHLSEKDKALATGVQAVKGLSESDQNLLYRAFDACITAAQFADIVAQSTAGAVTGGATGSSDAVSPITTCLAAKLTSQYSTSGDMFKALFGQQGQASILSTLSACGLPGISPSTSAA